MLYQYHCACCNQVVASTDKECPNCGSHHIRSPYGFWLFCLTACFVVVCIFQLANMSAKTQPNTPKSPNLIEILKNNP